MIDLRQGDNRVALRRMIDNGEFVDSVVCDPPYGLVSVQKRFGGQNAAPAKFGTDGAFARQSRGFMGKLWDGTGIERDPQFWSLVWQVMKPGAYVIAFSSSRTYGYMQVAMEAAGFITHPMFGWVFNSGFPKGTSMSQQIDQTLGVKGGRGKVKPGHEQFVGRDNVRSLRESGVLADGGFSRPWMNDPEQVEAAHYSYAPTSDEAKQWDGWKYGTQSLKPALEPVYFGQKPFSEKTGALNILRHGVGAVNIDGCRVGDSGARNNGRKADRSPIYGDFGSSERVDYQMGRYPANLIHDGSDEVVSLFPQSNGQQGDLRNHDKACASVALGDYPPALDAVARNDTGSAARFFNSFPHDGPIMCYPKAGKKDRAGSKHATVKPIGLMQHFVRLVTPLGGVVLDPFAGTGTTGQAALNEGMSCILMEAEAEYARDIRRRFDLPETVSDKLVRMLEALR